MLIEQYRVNRDLEIANNIFLVNEVVYATPKSGDHDYDDRKVYNQGKKYLDNIRNDEFPIDNLTLIKKEPARKAKPLS